ncbi:MAG TPA: aminotransferase class I/II-fold pyridoxal phosphate-dependent enzyme [Blastocatellia bacterium]|nr:aminotransferase class I/II-fold pyridoxal phosphate-dependent enzyme [Blastocatellia bacterium]
MNEARGVMGSEYMEWAKTRSQSRFNLATSGLLHYPISDLGVTLADLELSGPSWYGYDPLQRALAAKCDVSVDNVVAAIGTSQANHLAMAVVVARGDEVLIEQPAYDPLVGLARYLGADVKRFPRRFEDGFRLDPREIERAVTRRTRLIVITNLHNPSSALTENRTLVEIQEIARSVGARVLVDEVYLEALFDGAPSAFHLGSEFIATSSLTKAYGLSGLRCGWILAEAELAGSMRRLNDLFCVIPAHSAERLSVIALKNLDRIGERARTLLETNRRLLERFFESRDDLEVCKAPFGTTAFPRLKRGDVDKLCDLLRKKYETTVVPGRFFEMSRHFRIGIGCETEMLAVGLDRLGAALDEL